MDSCLHISMQKDTTVAADFGPSAGSFLDSENSKYRYKYLLYVFMVREGWSRTRA